LTDFEIEFELFDTCIIDLIEIESHRLFNLIKQNKNKRIRGKPSGDSLSFSIDILFVWFCLIRLITIVSLDADAGACVKKTVRIDGLWALSKA
jgi:hypothetical protein